MSASAAKSHEWRVLDELQFTGRKDMKVIDLIMSQNVVRGDIANMVRAGLVTVSDQDPAATHPHERFYTADELTALPADHVGMWIDLDHGGYRLLSSAEYRVRDTLRMMHGRTRPLHTIGLPRLLRRSDVTVDELLYSWRELLDLKLFKGGERVTMYPDDCALVRSHHRDYSAMISNSALLSLAIGRR